MKNTPKDIRAKAVFEACQAHDLSLSTKKDILNKKYKKLQQKIESQNKKITKLNEKLESNKIKYKNNENKLNKLNLEIENKIKEFDLNSLKTELNNTKKFIKKDVKLNFRKSKDQYSHIFIPKTAIKIKASDISIYPKYKLGLIKTQEKINNISCDFILRRHNKLNSWSIIITEKILEKENNKKYKTIILDPGIRTFLTGLDYKNNILEFGKDWSLNKEIKKRMKIVDRKEDLKGKRGNERFNCLKQISK